MKFIQAAGSGPSATNYGTNSGNYSFAQGVQGTDYIFSATSGLYSNGFLTLVGGSGPNAHMPYMTTAATPPAATLETINIAIGFRITAFFNGQFMLVKPANDNAAGGVSISGGTPSGGGNYDLQLVEFENSGATTLVMPTPPTALTFGTDYILSASCNVTTPGSTLGSFKFGANSVQTATANFTSFTWEGAWPTFFRRHDFSNYFAPSGRINFIAFQRGGNAWTSADLASINADPTVIPGWTPGPSFISRLGLLGVG
jgi:hypothetical protein